jgi:hypothetical protein
MHVTLQFVTLTLMLLAAPYDATRLPEAIETDASASDRAVRVEVDPKTTPPTVPPVTLKSDDSLRRIDASVLEPTNKNPPTPPENDAPAAAMATDDDAPAIDKQYVAALKIPP